MVQTFDFMSKKLQTCSYSKSNFDSQLKKNSWHSLMQENHVSMHKTYVYTNQTMLYLRTHFLEYTDTFLCPHSVFHLQQSSIDWQNYLVYS